jgi:hypothetical protein
VRVSDEQVAFFRENGFLAIDAITTPDEIERMRVAYDEIFARRAGREEGMQFDLAGTDEDDREARCRRSSIHAAFPPRSGTRSTR